MTDDTWFSGDEPRTPHEQAFLAGLRAGAARWDLAGLDPDLTGADTSRDPLLVTVDLPVVGAFLQIAFWADDSLHSWRLTGGWGDQHVLDNHSDGPDDLTVLGVVAGAETFGAWAADWLDRQLHRPVEKLDWLVHGQVAKTRWQLAGSGRHLRTTGSIFPARRRRPDRITVTRTTEVEAD
ncbi:hypothetical protein [Oerskovia rustica]|uniref:Uncharacterized protein n=1 Tax=Oerskovia rustica TaxID=2762237 RepID=A0ABR8RT61_9CELL|nr:hypothetical protein [Oerskovia rustica]MBD7950986.1 hypothetical protein [Oerskovia rustica]